MLLLHFKGSKTEFQLFLRGGLNDNSIRTTYLQNILSKPSLLAFNHTDAANSNMSFWNRLQKSFPRYRNSNSLKSDTLPPGLLETVVSLGVFWAVQDLGLGFQPKEEKKTFKESHQPRALSNIRDGDPPEES